MKFGLSIKCGWINFVDIQYKRPESSHSSSKISSQEVNSIMDRLKSNTVRKTTKKNYLSIWRQFNKFLIRLDDRPQTWEERVALFCTYLINRGAKSSTISSYISAIKAILRDDGYSWNNNISLLQSLTNACKLQNNIVKCRLLIQMGLLEVLLFEIDRMLPDQLYLRVTYQAIFCLAYYGLMRIGELTQGDHPVKAKYVLIARNKNKILLILYSSKTHAKNAYPQKIKITASSNIGQVFFCPFLAVRHYVSLRGSYRSTEDNFFVFKDNSQIKPSHVREMLRNCLQRLDLESSLYDTHSFRIGRCNDLLKMGFCMEKIKEVGRWRSNAVYKYLRQ